MTYLIEFPLLIKSDNTIQMQFVIDKCDDKKFGTVAEAENFIREPDNNYLSEHGIVNIVKVEKTIVHRVDIKNE